uniref:CUB and sushi domain-containing protein 3-like n=1 Tax=Saccoglossus kowalevskii TaxID=10224 RepID=A0ABM0MPL7_SACKO|nr:PREDICTED: CUB and sushi domain-containing protein 3-like [Saccoglossus kowalevskii]
MDVCGGESLFLRLAVAMLLSVALVKETDANWGECPGGCCDCIPIPPCPDLSCIEPLPLPPPDTVPPKLHGCPQHIPPRSISSGRDTVSVCWKEPWASDNRGPSYFKPLRQGPQPCSEFREGTHIISYTATDLAGNKAECQFRIVIHAIVCNQLNAPPNTRMQCSLGNRQGSVCTYYCNANYYLVSGSKQRDCGAGGRWSGTEANCQIRRCDILMPPVNGDLRCRGGDIPGSTCTYTCNVGYYLESGTETRRCRADGHWTGSEARCRAIRCSQLSAPPHGYLSCSGLNPGSTCHYRCDVGYYITVGSTTRTCNTNGDWTGANGICERKVEPCPHLPSPSNGHISCYGDNNPGSWCQYHCNAGYTLHGPASRVCSNDGRWTGSDSQCQLRSCATLSPPVNGLITCTAGNAVGSRCQYSCNDGLRLVRGSAQRTCQESGSWSGTEAVCEEISCPELSSPRNGYVRCNGYTYGSRCDYECQSGYSVGSGSSSRTCQNNGRWSGREVLCTRVECHDLPNPRNGYVQCQGDSGRRRCTYYCNTGYVIESGSQYRDCNNGQWSGREVFCRSVSCRPLNNPRHGNVNCQGNNEPGTRCTYRCNDSAQQACRLAGSSVRECGRDGEWSGTEPVCHCEANRECPRLHAPPNAVIMCFPDDPIEEGTYCDYVCNAGYQHVSGPRRTVCLGRAGWTTEEQAVCRANPCPRLPRIPNGDIDCSREDKYLVSTRCDYRCHSGYTLTPDAVTTVRVCRADGTWSGVQGRCGKCI